VNGQKVNIPSYQVNAGDVIAVTARAKEQLRVKAAVDFSQQHGVAEWLEVDPKKLEGTYKSIPERSELSGDINEQLIVELYSK
jgi:small subunit ribosomal protein S4